MPKKLGKDHKYNEKLAKIRKSNVERHAGYGNALMLRANIQMAQRNARSQQLEITFARMDAN